MSDCISTNGLTKYFGKICAVNDVSLHVREGEIYGFLGLNGAGKTTTIRMLLGMIRPSRGEAYLFGKQAKPATHGFWNDVGYLVEIPYSYPDLTVKENLEVMRRLRSLPDPGCVDSIIDHFKLGEYRDRRAKDLSLGNAQRLGLAKAMIHNPRLLILDEPANSLDPEGIVEIRELLRALAAEKGVTIFISSHILGEISKFADRIGIIHEGRLITEIDTGALGTELRRKLNIDTRNNRGAASLLRKEGYAVSDSGDGPMTLEDRKAMEAPEDIATLLVNAGYPPVILKIDEEDLESYFLRVIGSRENQGHNSPNVQQTDWTDAARIITDPETEQTNQCESVFSPCNLRACSCDGVPHMNYLSAALWSEILKVRRSKVFPVTLGFFAFVAMMMGLLMIVAKHPELAGRSATLSAKASFLKNGNWSGFIALILQAIMALGPLGYGIVTSWVFGREYADHTAKDLLALPVSRSAIVTAKFVVVVMWSILLSVVFLIVALLTALAVNIPGWSYSLFQNAFSAFSTSVVLTIILCTPVAFVASLSRSYLLPVGYIILVLIMTQLVGMALPGVVVYFPWIIPALCSGMAGSSLPQPQFLSYLILGLTGAFGFVATVSWWQLADQT